LYFACVALEKKNKSLSINGSLPSIDMSIKSKVSMSNTRGKGHSRVNNFL